MVRTCELDGAKLVVNADVLLVVFASVLFELEAVAAAACEFVEVEPVTDGTGILLLKPTELNVAAAGAAEMVELSGDGGPFVDVSDEFPVEEIVIDVESDVANAELSVGAVGMLDGCADGELKLLAEDSTAVDMLPDDRDIEELSDCVDEEIEPLDEFAADIGIDGLGGSVVVKSEVLELLSDADIDELDNCVDERAEMLGEDDRDIDEGPARDDVDELDDATDKAALFVVDGADIDETPAAVDVNELDG